MANIDNSFIHHYLRCLSGHSTQVIAKDLCLDYDRNTVQRWSNGNNGKAWWPNENTWYNYFATSRAVPSVGHTFSRQVLLVIWKYIEIFQNDSEENARACLLNACRDWLIDPEDLTQLECAERWTC